MKANQVLVVFVTWPSREQAEEAARQMVESGLAACVTLLPQSTAWYRWQGNIESAEETPLLIKTTQDAYHTLEQWITANHPYEVPEILGLPVDRGLPAYLRWVDDSVHSTVRPPGPRN